MSISKTFLELLLSSKALKFGDFLTKSQRRSPYFLDFGMIADPLILESLGNIYAEKIFQEFGQTVDVIYGPAYKGISLAMMTALSYTRMTKRPCKFCYNRKEEKTHGEGGKLLGHRFTGGERLVIVDDVITRGTSLRESVNLLKIFSVTLLGAVIGVDRQERGLNDLSAKKELIKDYHLSVISITTIQEVVATLQQCESFKKKWISPGFLKSIEAYRKKYGC